MSNIDETSFLGVFHKKALPEGATPSKIFILNVISAPGLKLPASTSFGKMKN